MKNNLAKFLAVGSLVAGGLVIGGGSANAGVLNVGDTFGFSGNVYATLNQFDFVGPPPNASPIPQSINSDGFFTIIAGTGGFSDAVFNRPQVPTPSGFIKDIRETGTLGSIIQEGPIADGSFGPVVDDFLSFDNLPSGIPVKFTTSLETFTRVATTTGLPPLPTTPIGSIRFDLTGILKDEITGRLFEYEGSLTPNIGSGSVFNDILFEDLTEGDDFIGGVGATLRPNAGPLSYAGNYVITREIDIPESSPVGALVGFGLVGSAFALKRKVKIG